MHTAIIGAQWGDEGKGKIVDLLAEKHDVVCRYNGGNNAGHTVVVGDKRTILHILPSGILHKNVRNIIGNGTVIDLANLRKEVDEVTQGHPRDLIGRLYISTRAHVILPKHLERDKGDHSKEIGTTGRGIGPSYADKVARKGITVGDLIGEGLPAFKQYAGDLEARLDEEIEKIKDNRFWATIFLGSTLKRWKKDELAKAEKEYQQFVSGVEDCLPLLKMYAKDTFLVSQNILYRGGKFLFEGAQGTMLDLDHGTYPYVTSSNTTVGGISTGLGIPLQALKNLEVLGVLKAYTTRVGAGPFPTELGDEEFINADREFRIPSSLVQGIEDGSLLKDFYYDNYIGSYLRHKGGEFGATTGRPRRTGWLDLAVAKKAARLNGFTGFVLTKLDVLNKLEKIPVCFDYFPENGNKRPIYRILDGWNCELSHAEKWDDFPDQAKCYIDYIQEYTGVPIKIVSVGPERNQTVFL